MNKSADAMEFERRVTSQSEIKKTVLLAVTDIYAHVGGGQTAYRAIIDNSPDTLFYYFIEVERENASRPANAKPIRKRSFYFANTGSLPAEMGHFYPDYLEAWQLARSFIDNCPGVDLDVIDTPDYHRTGLFIRSAFEMHGVKIGVVALALHGTISSALEDEWGPRTEPRSLAELRLRERLQYQAVDCRYALSEAYAEELTRKSGGHVANLIDPLIIVGPFAPQTTDLDTPPDIAFVGRRERRKGPDLFIDALWSLDRATYDRARVIGSDSSGSSGVSSADVLERMVLLRSLDVDFVEHLSRAELDDYFLQPVIVMLPSRYDQFNLVALEALRQGAPVFVSQKAGVSRWITETLPELSHLVFDISGARSASRKLRDGLADYASLREQVVNAIIKRAPKADVSTLSTMYDPAGKAGSARHTLADIRHRLDSFNRPRDLSELAHPSIAPPSPVYDPDADFSHLPQWKQAIMASPLRPLAEFVHVKRLEMSGVVVAPKLLAAPAAFVETDLLDRSPRAVDQLRAAVDLEGVRQRLLHTPERTREEVDQKLKIASDDSQSHLVSRAQIFRDMARLERKRPGGEMVAATYCMRLMRWMGEDRFGDLDFVITTLTANGFAKEAEVTQALFGDPAQTDKAISALLEKQLKAQKRKALGDFSIQDDRRGAVKPKVSVIVSLYNAETKLKTFLNQLAAQSLVAKGGLEFVLVDSGSPTDEYSAFKSFMENDALPVLYVRTAKRETIQAAWNRGIQLARAPYLSFLGVDEGVHPDAYQILSGMLDSQPDVDWVMADSVVTNVDRNGGFVSDVMTYDRRGYDQPLVQLETCYLSWVGGLYRRRIHDEIGFYDETFRGAGDTEFKSRVMPFAKSAHVPQTLGLFLNYPEERTTQHPRAEIEDQRAWYIFRSRAGQAYTWDGKPIEAVENFFRTCLQYRKSYCNHWSTDFDMAHAVALYMVERGENPLFAAAAVNSMTRMLDRIRKMEILDLRLSPKERRDLVGQALTTAKNQEIEDMDYFDLPERPRYEIFNDNRYEQHWYSWSV